MNDNKAIDYEYLVRKAYNSGRSLINGADGDIYRKYCRAFTRFEIDRDAIKNNKIRTSIHPIEELEDEAKRAQAKIVLHIRQAIIHVKNTHEFSLTDQQKKTLEDYLDKLHRPSHEEIELVIDDVSAFFSELGLSAL